MYTLKGILNNAASSLEKKKTKWIKNKCILKHLRLSLTMSQPQIKLISQSIQKVYKCRQYPYSSNLIIGLIHLFTLCSVYSVFLFSLLVDDMHLHNTIHTVFSTDVFHDDVLGAVHVFHWCVLHNVYIQLCVMKHPFMTSTLSNFILRDQ